MLLAFHAIDQKFPRRPAGMLFKDSVKVGEIVETRFQTGIHDMPCLPKAAAGELDPPPIDILSKGFTRALLEHIGESSR